MRIRPGGTGDDGEDPVGFADLMAGLAMLYTGHLNRQPSLRALAAAAGVGKSTIDNWLSGRTISYQVTLVLAMVDAIAVQVTRRGLDDDPAVARLLDPDRWKRAHRVELRRRAAVAGRAAERERAERALQPVDSSDRVILARTGDGVDLARIGADPGGGSLAPVGVQEADPRLLGVHPAVKEYGVAAGFLPPYVPRDVDTVSGGVRAAVRAAQAEHGGFVLLVGGSSVGKTRSAYEAITDLLPDWSLVHPDTADDIVRFAADPPARTVVWLDELQRYLDRERGFTAATVRALLQATRPVVLIGTLWSEHVTTYMTLPNSGSVDTNAEERRLLELAEVVRIPDAFSAAEKARAKKLATTDSRLRRAVESTDYGVTQVLAAAPQLVDRWEHADPYARAVLSAAIDATHLGVRTPLPAALLRQAASGYCDARAKAAAPVDWWERSLAYATAPLHGAASALAPVGIPGGGMGEAVGYVVADYLRQHTFMRSLYARPPASLWEACLDHVTDPNDNLRLCNEAYRWLLFGYFELFYERSRGDWHAAQHLAYLLGKQGRVDEAIGLLLPYADGTHGESPRDDAVRWLNYLLARHERIDELRARADSGDREAGWWLNGVLAKQGRMDELQARAGASGRLVIDVPPDDPWAYWGAQSLSLDEALARYGRVEELRVRAGTNNRNATERLAYLLARQGQADEAIELLRPLADSGSSRAAERLAELLAAQGRIDELRARADAGDDHATSQMAHVLIEQGRVVEAIDLLQNNGGPGGLYYAQLFQADLLAEQGRAEELQERAYAGEWKAIHHWADLLAKQGRLDEALEFLQSHADRGNGNAAEQINELLAEYGREEELQARADADDWNAAEQLAQFLVNRGGSMSCGRAPIQAMRTHSSCWPNC